MSCLPGTANCTDCVIGEYQVRIQPFLISATLQWLNYSMAQSSGGQIVCLVCPPGHYCPQPNTHTATPCPAGPEFYDYPGEYLEPGAGSRKVGLRAEAVACAHAAVTPTQCKTKTVAPNALSFIRASPEFGYCFSFAGL